MVGRRTNLPRFSGYSWPSSSVRETLILVGYHRACIFHLLHVASAIEYVFGPQGFELSIRKRNRVSYVTFFIPESDPTEIGFRSAYLAERRAINRLIHIPLAIDQDHMDIVF